MSSNSSSYEMKYLKYKMKYLTLKNQVAGAFSIPLVRKPTKQDTCYHSKPAPCNNDASCEWSKQLEDRTNPTGMREGCTGKDGGDKMVTK